MEYLTPKDFADDNPLSTVSRRVFIKGLGFVSVALLVSTLGGCDKLADAIKNRPVRRRLRTGSPEVDADINTYRNAVQQIVHQRSVCKKSRWLRIHRCWAGLITARGARSHEHNFSAK